MLREGLYQTRKLGFRLDFASLTCFLPFCHSRLSRNKDFFECKFEETCFGWRNLQSEGSGFLSSE